MELELLKDDICNVFGCHFVGGLTCADGKIGILKGAPVEETANQRAALMANHSTLDVHPRPWDMHFGILEAPSPSAPCLLAALTIAPPRLHPCEARPQTSLVGGPAKTMLEAFFVRSLPVVLCASRLIARDAAKGPASEADWGLLTRALQSAI